MAPVKRGIPTLLLVDPLPMVDIRLAPAADLANQINPYQREPAARLVFGNIREALESLGLNWTPAKIAWDAFNPHPDMSDLPQETVFVSAGNGNPNAFNRTNPATSRLQEVMLLYPGYLLTTKSPDFTFEPLLQTGQASGSSSFFDLVVPTQQGMLINAKAGHDADHRQYVLAARAQSRKPIVSAPGARPTDVIAIADIDFISDYFFNIRAAAPPDATFDNITFFLNAIDLLAGDDAFIALRSRRARHRTLERLEAQTRTFAERRTLEEQDAEKEADAALRQAKARLKSRVDELNGRTDLDIQAKQIMVRNLEETENRQLQTLETRITEAKDIKIRASRETMETHVRNIRTRIRTLAVLLPPLPVLLVGAGIFVRRARRERENARAMRRFAEAL
jgi:ABC-2 type transport system permease protein